MKPRHAAALALVVLAACAEPSVKTTQSTGWQIMRPPQMAGKPFGTFDESAPLSKWAGPPAGIDAYPSQKECEQMIESWREGPPTSPPSPETAETAKNDDMLRCVSINDPALKRN
jgi:hypothetical protein